MRSATGIRPRVLRLIRGQVRCEVRGAALRHPGTPARAALLAHYSDQPQVTRSFRRLVAELHDAGYTVAVMSSATCRSPLDWGGDLPGGVTVLRKPNVGYDFGSWTAAMAALPTLTSAGRVIVANDSLVGPFASIDHLIGAYERSAADVWGLTETRQFFPHLQSYFLGFSGGVLRDRCLSDFWRNVRQEATKTDVIWRNELGLARLLRFEGFSVDAAYVNDDVVAPGSNPTIIGWEKLLVSGFPFVKREIVVNPDVAPRGQQVAVRVSERFGERLSDWI